MKKSQVLAALALAFALGVVVPVAGTHAIIVDAKVTDADQLDEVYQAAADALEAADELEHITEYADLYDAISSKDGLADGLKKITDNEVRWFNENEAINVAGSTNGYINAANAFISDSKLYKKNPDGTYKYIKGGVKHSDDELTKIGTLGTVSSVSQAVKVLRDTLSAVRVNISILQNNYTYDSSLAEANYTDVEKAIAAFDGVRSHLSSELDRINKAYNDGDYYDFYESDNTKKWKNVIDWDGGTLMATLQNDIKAIDKDVEYNLVRSGAWTDLAEYPGIQLYNRATALISAAEALPKYSHVNAVIEAKANVEKISKDNPTNVSYAQAQGFITILNTAIKNYREGKADNGNNGNQGEGSNKPDQNAPDTGILANAEGSASTTVAMVAGIATALTAAGAGVVAYRNARRSSRK